MRVTNRMLVEMIQDNIVRAAYRMSAIQTKMSTAKRVNTPSDDPPATAFALSVRSVMSENDQRLRNIDSAKTWLNATEASLQNLEDLILKANSLAVRAANGTWSQDQLLTFAEEAEQLLQQAIQIGNSNLGGDYLFAGFKVRTTPFTYDAGPPPTVTYNGDGGAMMRTLGRDSTITVNIPGSNLFLTIFDTLIALRQNLLDGNQGEISSQRLPELDQSLEAVSCNRGEIGAKINRLEDTGRRYATVQLHLSGILSKAEDLDFAEAITELSGEETVYRAALAAAAKITQYSFLDYMK